MYNSSLFVLPSDKLLPYSEQLNDCRLSAFGWLVFGENKDFSMSKWRVKLNSFAFVAHEARQRFLRHIQVGLAVGAPRLWPDEMQFLVVSNSLAAKVPYVAMKLVVDYNIDCVH
jgi:hypothetical protein